MFGINGSEFIILAIIAVIVLGPERLPEYAAQLARLVKELRRMATGAREQLREEAGVDLDDVDWRKLDPRQYDPRRIIKEALLDDFEDALKPLSDPGPSGAAGGRAGSTAAGTTAAGSTAAAGPAGVPAGTAPLTGGAGGGVGLAAPVTPAAKPRLSPGQRAPYDVEAT